MNPADLKQIVVLQQLEDDALARLAAVLEEQRFSEGDRIFSEGEPGDAMYFIAEGTVRVERATDATRASRKTLSLLEAGDYLGEMALLERKPRSASAVAASAVRLWRFSAPAFDGLLRESSAVALSVVSGMLRTASDRLRRLSASVIVYDEIGKAIGESKSLSPLLAVVLRQLCHATQADWGVLLLKAQFAEQFEVRATENLALTPAQKSGLEAGKGLVNRVLESRQELLVRNLPEEAELRPCDRLGIETPALLLVPILINQEVLGVLLLGHPQPAQFDLNHLNLAQGVARQTAQAILNARHREEEESRARHDRRFVRF